MVTTPQCSGRARSAGLRGRRLEFPSAGALGAYPGDDDARDAEDGQRLGFLAEHDEADEKRERRLPHLEETTWRAVEQSLEGYAPWTGPSSALPRVTIDSVQSLGSNVEAALAFIAS